MKIERFNNFKQFDFQKMMDQISEVNDILESLLEDGNFYHKFTIILEYDYEIKVRKDNQFIFFHNISGYLASGNYLSLENSFTQILNKYNTWRIILGIYIYDKNKEEKNVLSYSYSYGKVDVPTGLRETITLINERLKDEDFLEHNSESHNLGNPNRALPGFFLYQNTTSFFIV